MRYSTLVLTCAAALILGVAAPTLGQVINEDLKLLPGDGVHLGRFGGSVAIDNGIVAVGAYGDDDNGLHSGSAYLFDASTGEQIAKLLPDDGAANDCLGYSIAIDNGIVAVGGYYWFGSYTGTAYLFDASNGAQIAKLIPDDGFDGDAFGYSIAIDNGVVAVGAYRDDENGTNSGSAYLFDAATGAQIAKLLPDDGGADDEFGCSIAMDNGIVAVGAIKGVGLFGEDRGSAYLFDAATGVQISKLLPDDGQTGRAFGRSIAIDNGLVAVAGSGSSSSGSKRVYLFDASTGAQIMTLVPADGKTRKFGDSIAIDNGIVAVGEPHDRTNGLGAGSAFVFDASTGIQIAELLATDGDLMDKFGNSIAIENGVVAVGAYSNNDSGSDSGSAYLFDDVGSIEHCLGLFVKNLEVARTATFRITNGTPGTKVIAVYGVRPGETSIDGLGGYCATFGINGVDQTRVIGGFNNIFDANGEVTFELPIGRRLGGQRVLFQAALQGTCPQECLSNLIETTVEGF